MNLPKTKPQERVSDTFHIAITDDSAVEALLLSNFLKEYASVNRIRFILHSFTQADELLKSYHPYAYAAIFMDIYMPGQNGIEAAGKLLESDRTATVVFLTSSDEHMPEAFLLHAFDYIQKPVDKRRLFKTMDDILLRQTTLTESGLFTFTSAKTTVSIPFSELALIRTSGHNNLEIMDVSGKTYLTRLTYSQAAKQLSGDDRFLTVLRGVLVNMDQIESIEGEFCTLRNGTRTSINVKKAAERNAIWQNYILSRIREGREERSRGNLSESG